MRGRLEGSGALHVRKFLCSSVNDQGDLTCLLFTKQQHYSHHLALNSVHLLGRFLSHTRTTVYSAVSAKDGDLTDMPGCVG